MDKNVKTFAIVGTIATLSIAGVSIAAIYRDASWAATGIIVGIVCATITIIIPVAQSISLKFKRSGKDNAEFDVNILSKDQSPRTEFLTESRSKPPRSDIVSILVVRSRPAYLYEMLGANPESAKKHRWPTSIVEHKPEYRTIMMQDNEIIHRAFESRSIRVLVQSLDNATKGQIASEMTNNWDIVHFDCVIGPDGQLFLDDGEIHPTVLKELLVGKNIKLLVLMDCDSVKVVATAASAGVSTLIAATGSLPIVVAEKFCDALYSSLAIHKSVGDAFSDAKSAASVEFEGLWDSNLFFIDGDESIAF